MWNSLFGLHCFQSNSNKIYLVSCLVRTKLANSYTVISPRSAATGAWERIFSITSSKRRWWKGLRKKLMLLPQNYRQVIAMTYYMHDDFVETSAILLKAIHVSRSCGWSTSWSPDSWWCWPKIQPVNQMDIKIYVFFITLKSSYMFLKFRLIE